MAENKVIALMQILKKTSFDETDICICHECGDMGKSDDHINKILKKNNVQCYPDEHFIHCSGCLYSCPIYCTDCVDDKFYVGFFADANDSIYRGDLIICNDCAVKGEFDNSYDSFEITVWDGIGQCSIPTELEGHVFKTRRSD